MAEISLRAYVREIDDLIEHEQLDEAIAHARHILQTFPRHLDTYRLLGKAYLEAKRFGDSADIMQRVLSAVPDDFVAHVGMSIVREDEGNLEAAIWHMERAFETSPSNAAVQGELRRLIGRRDGLEPHKVRLTRGALARMYAHGELHPQAIAELRAALQEDPDRPDLQVLLAEMYWRTNQRAEAGEVSASITETLPNCRDANRILAAVLHAQGRTDEALTYHRRVAALDPYAALVESVRDDPTNVDANAVRIEKLVWRPGQPLGKDAGPPEWATGLGAEARGAVAAAARPAAPRPSWLDSMGAATAAAAAAERRHDEEVPAVMPSPAAQVGPESPPAASTGAAPIPDWMQAAGWSVGTGEGSEGPVSFSDDELRSLEAGMVPPEPAPEPEGGLARAEIPDWLKDVAPPPPDLEEIGTSREEDLRPLAAGPISGLDEPRLPPGWAGPSPGTSEDDDDWLKAAAEEAPALPTWMEEQSPGATATIVTWLGDRTKPESAAAVPETATPEPALPESALPVRAELPEWLVDQAPISEESVDMDSASAGPAWLSGVAEAAARGSSISPDDVPWAGAEDEPIKTGMYPEPEAPAAATGLPDWLQTIAGAESASRIRPRPETTPEWMTAEPAQPRAAPTPPREPAGESFGWLRELAESEPPTPAPEEPLPAEAPPPAWLAGARAADSSRSALGRSAGPEWLRGIAEPEPAPGSAQESPPMDWLRGIAEPALEGPIEPTLQEEPSVAGGPSDQDEAAEWVNLVGSGEGQPQPNYSTGEWLRLLKQDGVPAPEPPPSRAPAVAASIVPAPAEQMDDDQVFDWLEALAAKQSVPTPETIPSADVAPPTRPAAVPLAPAPEPAEISQVSTEPEAGLDWLDQLVAEEEGGTAAALERSREATPAELFPEEIFGAPTPVFEETMAAELAPSPEVPDWLKQLVAETPTAEPLLSVSEEAEPTSPGVETWPALPAWMLAAQSAEDEPTVPPLPLMPARTEAEPAPEPIDELADSWVPPWEQLAIDEHGPMPAAVGPTDETVVRIPAGPSEMPEAPDLESAAIAAPKYQEPSTTEISQEVPDWLQPSAAFPKTAEVVAAEPEEVAEPGRAGEFDIPDWLTAPAPEPATPAMAMPAPIAPPELEELPAAVLPPVPAPPELPPALPVEPVAEFSPVAGPPAPLPTPEPRRAGPVPPPIPAAVTAPKPPLRAPKPKTSSPGLESKLQEARHALAVGDYRRAARDYAAVIKKKYQLSEVTSELELALDRNPKASELWQALGDAYMKGDRLQEAIDAYGRGVAVA